MKSGFTICLCKHTSTVSFKRILFSGSAKRKPSFVVKDKRGFHGATGRTRTDDLRITNALLYQLSHSSILGSEFADFLRPFKILPVYIDDVYIVTRIIHPGSGNTAHIEGHVFLLREHSLEGG